MGPAVCRTILIVEDEPLVRRFLAKTLTEAGYSTIEASDGREAKSVMQTHQGGVALVISDILMPGGGGLDFANELSLLRPGTPVLYISGLVDSIAVNSIVRSAPEALLRKPFTSRQLLQRVEDLIGARTR